MILGKVLNTFSAPVDFKGSVRPIKDKLICLEGYGIEGDKFALKDLNKTVMIVGINAYDLASSNGIDLPYGSLGENIIVNFDPHALDLGTQLKIGEAIFELTQKCTVCTHLSVHDKKLPNIVKNDRGIYCKIIQSGSVASGLEVSKL